MKYLNVRMIHLREGQYVEIDDDERVINIEYDMTHFYALIAKESHRKPEDLERIEP